MPFNRPRPSEDHSGRARAAILLGFLGIPSFGLTAIAGLVLGLAGLRQRPRGWSIAATLLSLVVLSGWIGGLAGALDVMQRPFLRPTHHWPAGHQLGFRLAAMGSRVIDPAEPEPLSGDRLAALMARVPANLRSYGPPTTSLVVEPQPSRLGVMLCCWIGAPSDPSTEAMIAEVDRSRGGLFLFGFDGREVWSLDRALDTDKSVFDDRESEALQKTASAARTIIQAADDAGGRLPDAIEATRLIKASGDAPYPRYRLRPGGVFDLQIPGTSQAVTFAGFGGVHVPILP